MSAAPARLLYEISIPCKRGLSSYLGDVPRNGAHVGNATDQDYLLRKHSCGNENELVGKQTGNVFQDLIFDYKNDWVLLSAT